MPQRLAFLRFFVEGEQFWLWYWLIFYKPLQKVTASSRGLTKTPILLTIGPDRLILLDPASRPVHARRDGSNT